MKKTCLIGTTLVSMLSWSSLVLAKDGAQQQTAKKGTSLADLKAICKNAEGNMQIQPFTSTFTCKEVRTFWNKVGIQKFPLANHSGVDIKAMIKDGAHQSDWESLPGHSEGQWGQCDVLEKIQATARYTVTFHSCAELEEVTTESEYCAKKLSTTWSECDKEQIEGMGFGTFVAPTAGQCEYVHLNIVKKCTDGEVIAPSKPQCQQQQQQQQQQCQQQQGQQQQQQCAVQAQQQAQQCAADDVSFTEFDLGGDIRDVVISKEGGLFHHKHHKAVVVTDVAPGGLLSILGLHKGDVVERINSHRTRNVNDFMIRIQEAKAKGNAKMEVRPADSSSFKKRTVSL